MSVEIEERAGARLATKSGGKEHAREDRAAAAAWMKGARVWMLGLWLGAALFFSFVVAPTAFSVLRSFQLANATEIAGAIVSRALAVVNTSGFIIGLLSLASAFFYANGMGKGLAARRVEAVSLLLLLLATGLGQWLIAARMQALRALASGPIEELAQSDPVRLAFGSLHVYSVAALSTAIIAAAVALVLATRRA